MRVESLHVPNSTEPSHPCGGIQFAKEINNHTEMEVSPIILCPSIHYTASAAPGPALKFFSKNLKKSFTAAPEPPSLQLAYQNPLLPNSMKMKLPLLVGLASLAALVGVHAQSAVTDPVGYITLNVTGTATSQPAISYVGASLVNKVEYAGSAVSGTGSTATFAAASFTAGAYATNAAPLSQPLFYVEITSGANAGQWTGVVSNTATTLTLKEPFGGNFTAGTTVKIRAHHTPSSLFGANTVANPLKLTGGVDVGSADVLQLISPTATVQLYYNTDEASWVTGATLANNYVIAPGVGIKVLRRGPATSIVQTGYVKTGPTKLSVKTGTNLIAIPRAVGSNFTYQDTSSNLLTSGLTGGVDLSSADVITRLSGVTVNTIIYNTDEGAFFNGATNANLFQLTEGTSIRIQRKAAPFTWTIPQEVIAN